MSFAAAQATYVLHSRPYKETSALVDFFTPLGRLRAVLRGARGKAGALARPFVPLEAEWRGPFEWRLLEQLGYGFALDVDIDGRPIEPQALYQLLPEAGLEPVAQLQPGLFQGSELLSMADADWSAPGALAAAKRLMRQALAPHLGGRPLVSRELFMNRKESPRD